MQGMYCKNCGKENPDNSRFCSSCGAMLVPPENNTPGEKVTLKFRDQKLSVSAPQPVPFKPAGGASQPVPVKPAGGASQPVPVKPTAGSPQPVPVKPTAGAPKTVPVKPAQGVYQGERLDRSAAQNTSKKSPDKASSGKKQKKHFSIGRFFIGLLVLALIVGLAFMGITFLRSSSKVVNINECIDISFVGYSGNGQAVSSINSNALKKQVEKALGEKIESSEIERMEGMIDIEVTLKSKAKNPEDESGVSETENEDEFSQIDVEHLSIGDTVEVNVTYIDLQSSYPDIEFKGKKFDVEVKDGLKEYAMLDPFKYLQVAYEGISPFGKVSLKDTTIKSECPEEYLPFLDISYFDPDKIDNIAVGDAIHVKYKDDGQIKMREAGYKASCTEADIVVGKNDLARYVTDVTEIDADSFESIAAQADDKIRAYCVDKKMDPDTAKYQYAYLMIPKDGCWSSSLWDADVSKAILFYTAETEAADGTVSEVWLTVSTSALYLEKSVDDRPETVVYDIAAFSKVSGYGGQKEAENEELIARDSFNRIKIDM